MALLEAVDVSVRFGALKAVNEVGLAVDPGQIAALIGPNGAGKTTLFNAITGVQRCEGRVIVDGVDVSEASPQKRARLGMNRSFQRLEVFGTMTAYDNIRTAAEIAARSRRSSMGGCAARADELVAMLGLTSVASRRADSLPTGQARLVELGRVLATDPKVMLLDEPASGLDEHETDRLAEVLLALRDDGIAILLVEHDIDLVMQLSSLVHVMDLGNLIAAGTPEEIRDNANVQEAYLGAA
jgi:branched-chain amino acid transport system ATP-binding protein